MRLSRLQKYILTICREKKEAGELKVAFYKFYSEKELIEKKKIIQDIVHKSLENLVAKDLLIAYSRKTAQKLFIKKVKLTRKGKKVAHELIKDRQRKLPIK